MKLQAQNIKWTLQDFEFNNPITATSQNLKFWIQFRKLQHQKIKNKFLIRKINLFHISREKSKNPVRNWTLPLSAENAAVLLGGANGQQREQACLSDPNRLASAEAIDGEIDLVHVLHHLPEFLRLHQRLRSHRRNPRKSKALLGNFLLLLLRPRSLGVSVAEIIVDDDGIGILGGEWEVGGDRVVWVVGEGRRNGPAAAATVRVEHHGLGFLNWKEEQEQEEEAEEEEERKSEKVRKGEHRFLLNLVLSRCQRYSFFY